MLFKNKIPCSNCKGYFSRITDTNKRYVWTCLNCKEYSIDEGAMKSFIAMRLWIHEREEQNIHQLIMENVRSIELTGKNCFVVNFYDQEPMFQKEKHIYFGMNA